MAFKLDKNDLYWSKLEGIYVKYCTFLITLSLFLKKILVRKSILLNISILLFKIITKDVVITKLVIHFYYKISLNTNIFSCKCCVLSILSIKV